MGFKKALVLDEIEVGMSLRIKDERVEGQNIECEVKHVFRLPTAEEREKYRNDTAEYKRGKIRTHIGPANRQLWKQCILRVSGYDDIETPDNPTSFHHYFLGDDIGKAQIDAAVRIFLEKIGEEEVDLEKK